MKFNNKFNFLIETLFVVWFFVVYSAYIYFHPNSINFIPIMFGGLFLLAFWHFIIKPLKNHFDFKFDAELWKFTIFLLIAILGIAMFARMLGNVFTENLNFIPFIFTEFNVITNILIKVVFLVSLVLLCASVGKKIFDIFKFDIEDRKEEFVFSFGLGFLVINYLSFFLTALGWLYFFPSLILVIALIIFSWTQIKYFINSFLKTKFKFNISADFQDIKNLKPWIWVVIIIFFIITFLFTFRLFPIEIDDLTAYFNIPQLYTHYHHLIPFYNAEGAIPAGIGMTLYALINILFAPHFVFHLAWLFLIFILFSVYIFTNRFFPKETALITIFLATFITWNFFFITMQKVEFIFAFISILALFSFFIWLNNKQTHWLYLAALFLGYSVSLKMNGLFLIVSLAIFLFGLFVVKKIKFKQCIFFSFIIFLFFLPIISQNIYYYQNPIPLFISSPFAKKTQKIFNQGTKVTPYDIYKKTDFAAKRNAEITLLGRQNHPTNSFFLNFLWSLWNITVNQKGIKFINMKISPYLLIFIPFFVLYFIKNKYYKEKNILYLSIISLIFFIFWYSMGVERVWYAIAVFYFLFIFSAIVLQNIKYKKYIFIIYFLIILFSFQAFIEIVSTITLLPNTIYYSTAQYKKKYNDIIPSIKIYNLINQKIINKNEKALILLFLELAVSGVKNNDKTTISDRHSVYWGKVLQEAKSLEEAKNILINQEITHILYNINFKNGLIYLTKKDPKNEYKIIKEIEIFEKFKDEYLTTTYCDGQQFCIYEIKK